jgi:hypothetical protein
VEWNGEREAAFTEVKQMLASATRLAHPAQAAKLSLAVDASASHIGACLQQKRAGSPGWEPLGFFSKKLEPAQVKYSAFDRELLACFLGIRHFRYMLEGRHFTIYTDHKPLTTAINRASDPWTARQCRQLAYVAEYTSDIRHIAGTSNVVADALSRPPAPAFPGGCLCKSALRVSGGRPTGRQVEHLFTFSCGERGGTRASGVRGLRGDGGRAGVLPGGAGGGGQPNSTDPAAPDPRGRCPV